ncbi:MAG TPA: NAD(+)/NADH kinase [Candidatus Aveggerthella stercoripullorum]|uniref:NAD(+)/NADH kinase n=1 Tax=Candidatus Aveggerthella stercoripullorum TaxID=2840688 RepID=A0A9D0ZZZ2_9ACTN|nr:NAD(+)/NADH kinase [Candidatus Aveggerthella stercoripullorum]
MKLLVINNLSSGYGEGAVYDFMRSFVRDGDEICLRSTDGTTDVGSLLDDATSFDAVVASGGDGTVAAVCYHLRNTGIPVMPFPAGTANLLILNLHSPVETHPLSLMARSGKHLDFDMGEIKVADGSYGFSIMAGAGYDADIMKRAKPFKHVWGPMAYFSAAVTNFVPQQSHFTIDIDGDRIERDGVCVLAVNFSKIQFDISVTHDNRPRDGKLDLVVLKAQNALELVPSILAAMLDREGDYPDRGDAMEVFSGREITVHADPPLEVQYDGETTGAMTPFTARILDRATRLVVSDEAYELFTKPLREENAPESE